MKKPKCYNVLKAALEGGTLASVRDISNIVPITVLTRDMRINYNTLSKRLLDPSRLTLADISRLAKLAGVPPADLFIRVLKDID
jgi:hypothetical protein